MFCVLSSTGRKSVHRVAMSNNPSNGGASLCSQQSRDRERPQKTVSALLASCLHEKHRERRGHADQRDSS